MVDGQSKPDHSLCWHGIHSNTQPTIKGSSRINASANPDNTTKRTALTVDYHKLQSEDAHKTGDVIADPID